MICGKENTIMEEMNKVCSSCQHKTKERSEKEQRSMMNRLSRIEGQVRGIKKMVENNAYCPDILLCRLSDHPVDLIQGDGAVLLWIPLPVHIMIYAVKHHYSFHCRSPYFSSFSITSMHIPSGSLIQLCP